MAEGILTDAEIAARVAERSAQLHQHGAAGRSARLFRYYRPLAHSIDQVLKQAQATERVHLGIPNIDDEMRGITPGAMCMVIGYSHSGKTLVELHAIRHNRDKNILMFMPDEPSSLLLTKLACIHNNMDARVFEARLASGDSQAIDLLRKTAEVDFKNLVHIDASLDGAGIQAAYDETCDAWGKKPDLVVFDYLELFQVGDTVKGQADWVKAFGISNDVPILVAHQTSRSAGAEGRELTISSGAYGGETHATFLIGVRRKLYAIQAELRELRPKMHSRESIAERVSELEWMEQVHRFTITINMDKNKRPGGFTVPEFDYELDRATGRIYPLDSGDLPGQYLATLRAARGEQW